MMHNRINLAINFKDNGDFKHKQTIIAWAVTTAVVKGQMQVGDEIKGWLALKKERVGTRPVGSNLYNVI